MRKVLSSAQFTIIAIAIFAVMFGGVTAADTTHGKAPPGQVIVLMDNDYLVIDLGTNSAAIGATNTVSPAGATSSTGVALNTEGTDSFSATSSTDVEQLQATTIRGVTTATKAGRSFRGAGKVESGLTTRKSLSEHTRTASLGDDARDRP